MLRIFMVEDHPDMRTAIRDLLTHQPDVEVCGEAETGEVALDQIDRAAADLVLIDGALPGMDGIAVVRQLRERHPELMCIMLSRRRERSFIRDALRAGARGYVVKRDAADDLPRAIQSVARGDTYLSRSARELMQDLNDDASKRPGPVDHDLAFDNLPS